MSLVGIIANPASGKDIRRLVAQGRFVPNQEKINTLRRILAGLAATGIQRVVMMPDSAGLGYGAMEGAPATISLEFLEMEVMGNESDTTHAARMMADMDVRCLITLGGDGTNRAAVKGAATIPMVPISTGTNNVFPSTIEGTVAGMAAGVVAKGLVDLAGVARSAPFLEVSVAGKPRDIALVDIAVSHERFVGARAIWDIETVHEIFLSRAEPGSIGLSAIGAAVHPSPADEPSGLRVRFGQGGGTVLAPLAPGAVSPIPIRDYRPLTLGQGVPIDLVPCTIALDGERSVTLRHGDEASVTLTANGPLVVDVPEALRRAAAAGVWRRS
ncbi:MAG: ATP-NAD kinase [SAR202 cluster bacterium]|nr:ATP-NAD kinase [SAR202 cluster bacterium]